MKLTTYLKESKIGRREFSRLMDHEPNWGGRILNGQRFMTLIDAMRVGTLSKGRVTLRDLRRYLSGTNQRAVNYATKRNGESVVHDSR